MRHAIGARGLQRQHAGRTATQTPGCQHQMPSATGHADLKIVHMFNIFRLRRNSNIMHLGAHQVCLTAARRSKCFSLHRTTWRATWLRLRSRTRNLCQNKTCDGYLTVATRGYQTPGRAVRTSGSVTRIKRSVAFFGKGAIGDSRRSPCLRKGRLRLVCLHTNTMHQSAATIVGPCFIRLTDCVFFSVPKAKRTKPVHHDMKETRISPFSEASNNLIPSTQ